MTNETTASQPKSIGDDAQFLQVLRDWHNSNQPFSDMEFNKLVDYLNSRAPAAQASATIQAAPEYRDTVLEEAAIACEAWGNEKVAKWADDPEMSDDAKARAWDSLMCAAAVRALKSTATIQEPVMVAEPVAHELMQQLGTMRAVFHTNMLRAYPEKSHAEITVEIDRALGAAPMVADPAGVAVDMRNVISNAIYGYGAMLEDHTGTVDAIAKALAATVKAVPSDALDAFAYFVQPSGFGPFIECSAQQPGSFVAYRAVKIAAPLADKTGGATFTENQLANACAELGVPDSTYESMCLLIKGGAV